MSSMTDHVPLRDPKHSGALFLLPREIRDEIYRLLVKGSYLDTTSLYRLSGKEFNDHKDVQPDFAILQTSKGIGREATEILYSESVFRFVITAVFYETKILSPDLDRMKRLAPMIQNVILDIDSFFMPNVNYEASMDFAIQIFGGRDIERRSLLVRMLCCSKYFSKGMGLPRTCQQLSAFEGFRATTLQVLPASYLLLLPPLSIPSIDMATKIRKMKRFLTRITQAVAEELVPVLGPATSGYRFDAGSVPIPDSSFTRLGDTGLIGYLEFHSNKHSVEEQVVKEDQT